MLLTTPRLTSGKFRGWLIGLVPKDQLKALLTTSPAHPLRDHIQAVLDWYDAQDASKARRRPPGRPKALRRPQKRRKASQ